MPKVVDLFCGAGGFSEGFRQAGFDIVLAIDYDEDALKTHMLNHPETDHLLAEIGHPDYKDVIVEIIKSYNPDVIIGSPPCQNFSIANTNKDETVGMELMNEFLRIVDIVNPQYWVGENVRGVKKYLDKKLISGLLLNSANYGVPQKRLRYFFGNYPKPTRTHSKKEWLTIGEIIEISETTDNMWMKFDDLPKVAKKRVCQYDYQKKPRGNLYKLKYKQETTGTMPAHGDVSNWLITHSANSSNNGDIIKLLDDQSLTVTTRKNFFITNKIEFRKFTTLELQRIMGFEDNYIFDGSRTAKIKQLGNAVCPPVAQAIGGTILEGRDVITQQQSLEAYF